MFAYARLDRSRFLGWCHTGLLACVLLVLLVLPGQAATVLEMTVEAMLSSPPPLPTPALARLPTPDSPLAASVVGSLSDTDVVKAVLRAASGTRWELAFYFRHVGKLPESVVLRLIWLMQNGMAPAQADAVADILTWQNSPAWRSYLVAQLRAEALTPRVLPTLFEQAATLSEADKQGLQGLLRGGGSCTGIATALLGDDMEAQTILTGSDVQAQKAVLMASRSLHWLLPLQGLQAAASRHTVDDALVAYLEAFSNDATRHLLQDMGRAGPILGRDDFLLPAINAAEADLVKRVSQQGATDDVYGVVVGGVSGVPEEWAVVVGKRDLRFFSYHHGGYRTEYRLTPPQKRAFMSFLRAWDVDHLEAGTDGLRSDHSVYLDVLHLRGGQGIRVGSIGVTEGIPAYIFSIFSSLSQESGTLAYDALEGRPGFRVLYYDEAHPAVSVRSIEGSLCLQIGQKGPWPRVGQWLKWQKGTWVDMPPPDPAASPETSMPHNVILAKHAVQFHGHHATADLFGMYYWEEGDDNATRITTGSFSHTTGSGDGQWMLTYNTGTSELYILNLADGTVTKRWVEYDGGVPLMWLPARKLFLLADLRAGKSWQPQTRSIDPGLIVEPVGPEIREPAGYSLIDPATGQSEAIPRDIGRMLAEVPGGLQPAGIDGAWAAAPDVEGTQVGILDYGSMRFTPQQYYPTLSFSSASMWMDAAHGYVYAVNAGQLLRLPLGSETMAK